MTIELPKKPGNKQAKGRPRLSDDFDGWGFNSMLQALVIDGLTERAKREGYAAPAEYAYAHFLDFDHAKASYAEEQKYIEKREALKRRVTAGHKLLREHRDNPEFQALINWMLDNEPPPPEEPIKFDPSKLRKKST
jgi:hypothetical protein